MPVQRVGERLHKRCDALAGRAYSSCWTRGGWPHDRFDCQHPGDAGSVCNSDWVDLRAGTVVPHLRAGRPVRSDDAGD